jgi:ribonucleoside-diphosphate reductase alpha chain
MYGPSHPFSRELHTAKYRADGETFDDYCVRYSRTAAHDERHFRRLLDALRHQRILPAGRQQLAVGRAFQVTANNCYVGGTIEDSMSGIMDECKRAAITLRCGGGCGWDFSTIRPSGDPVRGLGIKAYATGPVSFMGIWNSMCSTVMSAGHRRGAMMGVLRVDHADIFKFIHAKRDQTTLANFNISVAVTRDFMEAVAADGLYELKFGGRVYDRVRAVDVWEAVMTSNWDWAEPGVLFIDRINEMNPLGYCEEIRATNPCGEQPLPAHGTCLLGSLNVVKYLTPKMKTTNGNVLERCYDLDYDLFKDDVATAVLAFDRVMDSTHYPLPEQQAEQQSKRRMGLGVTGVANALEVMGMSYASGEYLKKQAELLTVLRDEAYRTSISLAKTRGSFPLFDAAGWLSSGFAKTLPEDIRYDIEHTGLGNGLLLSIAPTGTISLCADNVSSGIEPPYALKTTRLVHMPEGQREVDVEDYAMSHFSVRGKTADQVSAWDHVRVLCSAQEFVDSAVSKTCNVNGVKHKNGDATGVVFSEFKQLYVNAYDNGAKGCTTFNLNGKRFGMMKSLDSSPESDVGDPAPGGVEAAACFIDPATGARTCDA